MIYYQDIKRDKRETATDSTSVESEHQNEGSRRNFLLPNERLENALYMEHLPAHVWIQGEDNTIQFSNRLPRSILSHTRSNKLCGNKTRCCSYFQDRDSTCPCCPREKISKTLKPEKCLCPRGDRENIVYHFPYNNELAKKESVSIMKIEMEVPTEMFFDNFSDKSAKPGSCKQAEQKLKDSFIRVCASCSSIRESSGGWVKFENYFGHQFKLKFTHGICPECACKLYPNCNLEKYKET